METETQTGLEIAVIGMAGRFPMAASVDEFWSLLKSGKEGVTSFSDGELSKAGVDRVLLRDPCYVKRGGVLEGKQLFDGAFFGYSAAEAEVMDPQFCLFHEFVWEALENAGYTPDNYPGLIGLYAGAGNNLEWIAQVLKAADSPADYFSIDTLTSADYLTTRVAYKLDLKGPAVSVQTACSSSLVAIHLACQSLNTGECDMALAGGIHIPSVHNRGYLYQAGMILSPDGSCRPFDADAGGTVLGEGGGVIVLKRLDDAVRDRDHVLAIIKGSAINNDGHQKIGYTAPGLTGQADVIRAALDVADVQPETISYVEAHGSGTPLGDPIEVEALAKAFAGRGSCRIGSVKSNLGHLVTAAGVAGVIKTILALQHKQIPPSINFKKANPQIDFENGPFRVNTDLCDWERGETPRRAGVSSFGIGGTNAHVVLEEAPGMEAGISRGRSQLLLLSAKTGTALTAAGRNLLAYLQRPDCGSLADIAYTLQVGRVGHAHRRFIVCDEIEEAVRILAAGDQQTPAAGLRDNSCPPPVVFMFPGQGSGYLDMAGGLYEEQPVFRETVDYCAEKLLAESGMDIRTLLYPGVKEAGKGNAAESRLHETVFAQPALFTVEYALACLWRSWGVVPSFMIGHSLGEYVAACLSGVFSLDDALALVATRSRLMQETSEGRMLSILLGREELLPLLEVTGCSLAVVNGPENCVVSGSPKGIEKIRGELDGKKIPNRELNLSRAFHSPMMDPVLDPYRDALEKISFKAPRIPYVSNLTGKLITAGEATSPGYWIRHLRNTVEFAAGMELLARDPGKLFLEIGPGTVLASLVRMNRNIPAQHIIASMRREQDILDDGVALLNALGRLWQLGVKVDWRGFHNSDSCRRVPLPSYPFERRCYRERAPGTGSRPEITHSMTRNDPEDWFYVPVWKRKSAVSPPPPALLQKHHVWLIFSDNEGLGDALGRQLAEQGQTVIKVRMGGSFFELTPAEYEINPAMERDYASLMAALKRSGTRPEKIVHLWGWCRRPDFTHLTLEGFSDAQMPGFYSILFLVKSLATGSINDDLQLDIIGSNIYSVTGEETLSPQCSTVTALAKVVSQEYPQIRCYYIDLACHGRDAEESDYLSRAGRQLGSEIARRFRASQTAFRGKQRWIQEFEPLKPDLEGWPARSPRAGGAYLITGGLGGIGLVLAEYLARHYQAKLVLVGRSGFPAREEWGAWLDENAEDNPTSRKIRRFQTWEEMGAELILCAVDTADQVGMEETFRSAEERFGSINGVIHAAGELSGFRKPVQDIESRDYEEQCRSKVAGVLVLQELLRTREVDFCLLMSSLSAVLGGLGYSAYAAANAFMDAFAHSKHLQGDVIWTSVNWDRWNFIKAVDIREAGPTVFGMTAREGSEAFDYILRNGAGPQFVNSKGDLNERINKWVNMQEEMESTAMVHGRPDLTTGYVEPRNNIEKKLAGIWSEVLGLDRVGIEDNFFDLGGHSLLVLKLQKEINQSLQTGLSVKDVFCFLTIKSLAEYLSEADQNAEESAMLKTKTMN